MGYVSPPRNYNVSITHTCTPLRQYMCTKVSSISYPESSGFLVSRWALGEMLGNWNLQDFCSKTMQAITGQPIEKFNLFWISQRLSRWPTTGQRSFRRTLGTRLKFLVKRTTSAKTRTKSVDSVCQRCFRIPNWPYLVLVLQSCRLHLHSGLSSQHSLPKLTTVEDSTIRQS